MGKLTISTGPCSIAIFVCLPEGIRYDLAKHVGYCGFV